MRARHRHLKPSSVGATIAYDARYLTDADGTGIQTWADRSGNGRDLTQSTVAERPTFKTAIQGGQPVLRFDGSNDNLLTASYAVTNVTTGFVVQQSTQNSQGVILERSATFSNANFRYALMVELSTTFSWATRVGSSQFADADFATRSGNFSVLSFRYGGSDATFGLAEDGLDLTKTYGPAENHGTGVSASTATYVGARAGNSLRYAGDIGILYTIPELISTALRKRIEAHCALAYKIPLS
jgi:hypothetical protein